MVRALRPHAFQPGACAGQGEETDLDGLGRFVWKLGVDDFGEGRPPPRRAATDPLSALSPRCLRATGVARGGEPQDLSPAARLQRETRARH